MGVRDMERYKRDRKYIEKDTCQLIERVAVNKRLNMQFVKRGGELRILKASGIEVKDR